MNFKELNEKMKSPQDRMLEMLSDICVSDVLTCKCNFELNVNNKVTAILVKRTDDSNFNEIGKELNDIITQFSEILDDFIEEHKIDFTDKGIQ